MESMLSLAKLLAGWRWFWFEFETKECFTLLTDQKITNNTWSYYFLQVIQKIEAQGVKSGSVKHIKYPPIIVDCGIVEEKEEKNGAVEENEEKLRSPRKTVIVVQKIMLQFQVDFSLQINTDAVGSW